MCMAVAAMLIFSITINAAGPDIPNLTSDIATTSAYVNTINQSGYLVFYPNLTASYRYISLAGNQTNSSTAYALLSEARSSALAQNERMSSYKADSLYALALSSAVLLALLYALMRRPSKS